ncbi:MAG TPA: carboxymuconolactone decarboxylase family protein [Longimicrobium sp.]|jgi:AhpD family alkylhydroperoxidase|uniref:carboxymuconolactone decarboxylase family protein n=1 Tax=Longimicrobium sp. TaxID=2029185 RepID=UPI002EDACE68
MTQTDLAAPAEAAATDTRHAARLNYQRIDPRAVQAQYGLEKYVLGSGLEESLINLVKLRASVMNGCAYCVDMHTTHARQAGEAERRLYAVPVWRETPFFSPRERAALAWTEAVTRIGDGGVSDALYAEASAHFSEAELVKLTMAVVAINGWNRLAITFRVPVGQPPLA